MAKKKLKKKGGKKKTARKKKETPTRPKRKTAKKRQPARTRPTEMPAGKKSIKPFEVCNYFGVCLRDAFEREYLQNRGVLLGEVFEHLLSDVHGAWNMVKLYGKQTPIEKLRGESNPFHYDL